MKIKKLALTIISLFLLITAFGCSDVSAYKRLMMISALSGNQKETEDFVYSQKELFYKLREDVLNKKLETGLTKPRILSLYGDPVYCNPALGRKGVKEVCLWRHPTKYFFTDKVYLYFNEENRLDSFEFEAGRNNQ